MQIFSITEVSEIAQARRGVNALAAASGLGERDAGRAALAATEISSNLLKHGGGGELLVRLIGPEDRPGLELLGLDRGPGMIDVARCLQDGFSTGGGLGAGLGALQRIADRFDIYSQPDRGTAVLAQVRPAVLAQETIVDVGAVVAPKPGETESGDGWRAAARAGGCLLLGVDGLGHGFAAARAAREASTVFEAERRRSPGDILQSIHLALQATRGAAVAVLDIDFSAQRIVFAGVGNLTCAAVADGSAKRLASFNGIVGHARPRIRELTYPCPANSTVILHSDGLSGGWRPQSYPGLMVHRAGLIAGVLYRDFRRGSDDALVVAVRRDAA